MTYRIDMVTKTRDGRWDCSFKGVEGRGVYGRLITDKDGRGIKLQCLEVGDKRLLDPDAFSIPIDADEGVARICFAKALEDLGWGPDDAEWRKQNK